MTPSSTHLLLIPSYNTGPRLLDTVREALAHWQPVWVVVDARRNGLKRPWLYLALCFLVGLAIALPLYLAHRERALGMKEDWA